MSAYGNYPNPQCYDRSNPLHVEAMERRRRKAVEVADMIVKDAIAIRDLCKELGYQNELISKNEGSTITFKKVKAKCRIVHEDYLTAKDRRSLNRKPKTHFRK